MVIRTIKAGFIMNLHEYQAKRVLKGFGIAIPEYGVAASAEEAMQVVNDLQLKEAVVKIQVHAGGRGKAGGVKFAKSPQEVIDVAKALIGMKMKNEQVPEGIIANLVIISKPVDIQKEFYIGALIDREKAVPILIATPEGGMEIEEVAHKTPEKILKMPFSFDGKLKSYQLIRLAKFMGWEGDVAKQGMDLAKKLAYAFIQTDASLLEINPLVLTPKGELVVLDAKLSIDDNALFRQKELAALYDPSQDSSQEAAAKKFDLTYIAMHGEIGCMVNGAGLAMATMDIIQLAGGTPANFLDVGGSATKEKFPKDFVSFFPIRR